MAKNDPEGRGDPRVEIVIRDAEAEAKPRGRMAKAFALGLVGAFVFGAIASVMGYYFLPWYHVPDLPAELKAEVVKTIAESSAKEALKGSLMAQGISAAVGFVIFFITGFFKFGKKR